MNLSWDDPVPENLHRAWVEVLTMVLNLGDIILDRAVKPDSTAGAPDLIGFAEGSLEAM